jgi:uncharacterized protein YggE
VHLPLKRVLLAVVPAAIWPAAACAQFNDGYAEMAAMQGAGHAAISAAGTVVVERKPTQMRLYMQLLARGKTLEAAIEKLKERREAATTQLEAIKVDAKSIVFGTPNVSEIANARKKQIEAMVMAQMRSRGKKAGKESQAQPPVTVAAMLTAQWPLPAESPEQLLLTTQAIQAKIKAADLAGTKEKDALSEAQEEMEEEAAQMMNRFGEEAAQPGQPQFVFVATLAKSDREKAMSEAVAKAKSHAAELAKAAGVQLGPLVGLAGRCRGQTPTGVHPYDQSNRFAIVAQMMGQQSGTSFEEKPDEAMGLDPGTVKFTCVATVLFQVAK